MEGTNAMTPPVEDRSMRDELREPEVPVPDLEFFAKCWGTEIDDVDRVYIESELGPGR